MNHIRTKIIKVNPKNPGLSKIRYAAKLLQNGDLVAFPTETVYGLGADALNADAVKKIFKAKGRPADNPLIIHMYSYDDLLYIAKDIPKIAKKLGKKFWPGPLTLILKKSNKVPKITTGGLNTVAVRIPKNKIARLLIKEACVPLAAPSANLSGRPSPTLAKHVFEDLKGRIRLIIDGGKTDIGIESTVIDLTGKIPVLLRPGKITLEQLQKEAGRVLVHKAVYGKKSNSRLRSPGMKYRHYSPKAKIILVEGSPRNVDQKITRLVKFFKKNKNKVGVLATRYDNFADVDLTIHVGKSYKKIAANLFEAFRKFDENQIEYILAQGVPKTGLGLGIMNRLKKAAYKTITV